MRTYKKKKTYKKKRTYKKRTYKKSLKRNKQMRTYKKSLRRNKQRGGSAPDNFSVNKNVMGLGPYQGNTGMGFDNLQRGPDFESSQKLFENTQNATNMNNMNVQTYQPPAPPPLGAMSLKDNMQARFKSIADISEIEKTNKGVLSKDELKHFLDSFKGEIKEIIKLYPDDDSSKSLRDATKKQLLEAISSHRAKIGGLQHTLYRQKRKSEEELNRFKKKNIN